MNSEFAGQTVLITGAASGIGAATARQLSAQGARLVLADIDEVAGAELLRDVADGRFIRCDVRLEHDVAAAVALAEQIGGLDGMVNCAGIAGNGAPLEEIDLDEWHRVLAINLTGVFLGIKHALRVMKPRGRGAIVSVSSGAGVIGAPHLGPYCASKHGVLGLTKTAALENAAAGIRINAVLPGSTRTPMLEASMRANPAVEQMIVQSIPSGRLGTPEEIANAIIWLLGSGASYINGHSLLVDGGSVSR